MQMLLKQLSGRYGIAMFSRLGAAELQVSMETTADVMLSVDWATAQRSRALKQLLGNVAQLYVAWTSCASLPVESVWKRCKAFLDAGW